MALNNFSQIPQDVERLIIESAMEDLVFQAGIHPRGIPALFTACRRFKAWSYPIFYRSICLGDRPSIQLLERTLIHSPSLALFVRILVFTISARTRSQALNIISPCLGLTRLCYPERGPHPLQGWTCDISKHTALVRISGCLSSLLGLRPGDRPTPNSLLTQITHLDIRFPSHEPWYPTIPHLINLTHLFLSVYDLSPDESEVSAILPCLPINLQVCILRPNAMLYYDALSLARPLAVGAVDPRIVICLVGYYDCIPYPYVQRNLFQDLDSEWAMCHTGPDFWEEAEAIIRARSESARTA